MEERVLEVCDRGYSQHRVRTFSTGLQSRNRGEVWTPYRLK